MVKDTCGYIEVRIVNTLTLRENISAIYSPAQSILVSRHGLVPLYPYLFIQKT